MRCQRCHGERANGNKPYSMSKDIELVVWATPSGAATRRHWPRTGWSARASGMTSREFMPTVMSDDGGYGKSAVT
jgi:hypothetical protein